MSAEQYAWNELQRTRDRCETLEARTTELAERLEAVVDLFRECDSEKPEAGEQFLSGFARLVVSWGPLP